MYKRRRLHAQLQEKQLISQRAIVGIIIVALFMLLLLSRVAYLQIVDHQKYATLSNRNQLRLIPVPAPRGLVYDRQGRLIARNVPAFHLAMIPEQVSDPKAMLAELATIIPLSQEKQTNILDRIDQRPAHQRHMIKLKLTEEEVSRFSVNQFQFPGISLVVDLIRDYPFGELLGHIVGYVSEASKEEARKMDKKRFMGAYQIGKIGLEKFYEEDLQGHAGYRQIETDVLGRELRTLSTTPAQPGSDLHLTLDIELQRLAMTALGNNRGAIVALDPRDGSILALVSAPSFDPNKFVQGIDHSSYEILRDSPDRPLFNRAIKGQYPPASTLKPIVGLAGLATKTIQAEDKMFDPGWYQITPNGRYFKDMNKFGHGWTNLGKSIRESCDVYFYALSEKLGIDNLSTWLSNVGLGRATGIDLPGEQIGNVPTIAWKRELNGEPWYPGETLNTGIGQGYVLATPLQLAILTTYIANRGVAFKPHLNRHRLPEKLPTAKVKHAKDWESIIEPMRQVTQHYRGTAYKYFKGTSFDVAAKTGTAQVYGLKENEKYKHDEVAKHLRDHSIFIAFAPSKNPTIALAVILENERASGAVGRKILEAYLSG